MANESEGFHSRGKKLEGCKKGPGPGRGLVILPSFFFLGQFYFFTFFLFFHLFLLVGG